MRKPAVFSCILALLVVLLLGACGPVYNTEYTFSPPKSETGRSCTYHCDTNKFQCRQIEDMHAQRCQEQAYWEQQRCEAEIYRNKGRDPKWYECGTSSCSADYDRCEEQYRACYQSCGGKVESVTRCVANCEQTEKK